MFETSKTRTAGLFLTLAVTAVLGIQIGAASAQQEGTRDVDEPGVAARAWAVTDLRSGEHLAGEGASGELLMAALISSGDDAAYALAEQVGGGGGEAGLGRFVEEMNERARASGLKHTRFENPVGFDARGHSTALTGGGREWISWPREA